tara:strand:+ start:1471 stop:3645 length:2175 start_codon:yes stop_codon:yes gene_type:complete
MAQSYTRQSTFADGDTITAALFNDEYNQLLNAFAYSSSSASSTGHRHDGSAGQGGNIPTIGDLDFLNKITIDGSNNRIGFFVEVSSSAVEQIRVQDGAVVPVTDNDIDLGTSSLEFKDLYIDGTAHVDAINFNGTAITATAAELNILDGVTATASELNILDGVTSTTAELNILDGVTSTAAELNILDGVTSTAAELNILDGVTSTTAELNILDGVTSTAAELNILDGVTSTATELNLLDGSTAGTVVNSKAVIYGSSGEVKGTSFQTATNTSGNLLVANGSAFASTAVGDLSEISTVANDDVLLAVDTSGGGLKKIARSTLVAGLATSGAISNVVEDTTPQLGGNLDMNGQDIVTTSNADLELAPNGTGHVTIKGNTNSGAIQFNCESNSHGQIVKAQPHSAGVTNELLLPAGGNSTLVSLISTDTLTNKTLTSPKINEDVAVTATATELNLLDGVTSTTAELNILDGVTSTATELNLVDGSSAGTIVNSKAVVYGSSGEVNATTLQIAGTSITSTAAELNILDGVTATATELNILDGVTSTTAELNILDGVTSTAAELNILDGVTATATELNILDGVTATTAELNYLDITTLGLTEASKAVTADANGVVSFDNGTIDEHTTITSSSGAATINLRDGNVFEHDLTENVTYTFSNPAASGRASIFALKIIQDSSARTITWPNSVDWAAATAPTITTTNNGVDVFVFLTVDGGTTYYGFTAGQAMG